ncbi:MAG TPA: Mur ligase family protein [Thermomicrobiales bacterium]|jgi:cyanophycin synthetase
MMETLAESAPPGSTKPSPQRLPLVAIGGRWGKTTTARLLEAMLQRHAVKLALWTDQGVWVQGRRQRGELIPWGESLRSLVDGELDLAIQELDARTVNAAGLPPATYSLGIITSFCGNDRLCEAEARAQVERQAQLALIRAISPEGALVLNADDHVVADEGGHTTANLIYYSVARSNPIVRAHLAAGKRAVTISSGMIVLCEGRRSQPVVSVREVAIAVGGAIIFQVQNALAAVAAAWHLGVPPTEIAATLCAFTSSPTMMPGACNQFAIEGATVILDRFHDAVSARVLVRGLRKVPNRRRRIVVLSEAQLPQMNAPEIGRLLGQSFDQVIVHHDRGQQGGPPPAAASAVAKVLLTSIARSKMPPIVNGVASELVALDRLLRQIGPNDLALVLAVDQRLAVRTLMTHRAR